MSARAAQGYGMVAASYLLIVSARSLHHFRVHVGRLETEE
jgi:hypothetical protein